MRVQIHISYLLSLNSIISNAFGFYIYKNESHNNGSVLDTRLTVERSFRNVSIQTSDGIPLLENAVMVVRNSTLQRSAREEPNGGGGGQGQGKLPYCPNTFSSIPTDRPLLCYQCQGEARQKESICDNTLWHFARKAERYNLRIRCPNDRGFYCVKVIQEKSGVRLTERGCLGPGPIRILSGKIVPLNEGCVVYEQNGFITTSCLCRKDLCNAAKRLFSTSLPLILLIMVEQILFCKLVIS